MLITTGFLTNNSLTLSTGAITLTTYTVCGTRVRAQRYRRNIKRKSAGALTLREIMFAKLNLPDGDAPDVSDASESESE
jgi:hypothetical protein